MGFCFFLKLRLKKEGCFDTADVIPAKHKAVRHENSQVQAVVSLGA